MWNAQNVFKPPDTPLFKLSPRHAPFRVKPLFRVMPLFELIVYLLSRYFCIFLTIFWELKLDITIFFKGLAGLISPVTRIPALVPRGNHRYRSLYLGAITWYWPTSFPGLCGFGRAGTKPWERGWIPALVPRDNHSLPELVPRGNHWHALPFLRSGGESWGNFLFKQVLNFYSLIE